MTTNTQTQTTDVDWLEFPDPFPQAMSRASVSRDSVGTLIGAYLGPMGDAVESEKTELRLWYDDIALHVRARCETASMDRVCDLAVRRTPYARDAWGDDALELQIDVGRTNRNIGILFCRPTASRSRCSGSTTARSKAGTRTLSTRSHVKKTRG